MEYRFVVNATITLSVTVEADSLEAAVAEAQSQGTQSLCFQCASHRGDEWHTTGELDCDPAGSPVVEVFCDGEEIDIDAVKALW